MNGREVVLSKRLKSLTDMVTRGNRVVDVGCDHGFLSIYLVQQGISPNVLAMDVRKGPLSRAVEHIAEQGLSQYISTRLSDGLLQYKEGEAETLVCAGMGGRMMVKILTESEEKVRGLQELILQPQSEIPFFRKFLNEKGYITVDENIIYEDGKFYFAFRVKPQSTCVQKNLVMVSEEEMQYGSLLLKRRHPVLKEFLLQQLHMVEEIHCNLVKNADGERAKVRLLEVEQELYKLQKVLQKFEASND